MNTCDCLAQYADLPHYATCPCADASADNTDLRALAELAAFRDIDAALLGLRSVQAQIKPARRVR